MTPQSKKGTAAAHREKKTGGDLVTQLLLLLTPLF